MKFFFSRSLQPFSVLKTNMKLFVAKLSRDAVESDLLEWFGAMGLFAVSW